MKEVNLNRKQKKKRQNYEEKVMNLDTQKKKR